MPGTEVTTFGNIVIKWGNLRNKWWFNRDIIINAGSYDKYRCGVMVCGNRLQFRLYPCNWSVNWFKLVDSSVVEFDFTAPTYVSRRWICVIIRVWRDAVLQFDTTGLKRTRNWVSVSSISKFNGISAYFVLQIVAGIVERLEVADPRREV